MYFIQVFMCVLTPAVSFAYREEWGHKRGWGEKGGGRMGALQCRSGFPWANSMGQDPLL